MQLPKMLHSHVVPLSHVCIVLPMSLTLQPTKVSTKATTEILLNMRETLPELERAPVDLSPL